MSNHYRPPRKRRSFSIWTILAPAALLIFAILIFGAISDSCVLGNCEPTKKADGDKAKSASGQTIACKRPPIAVEVQPGESAGIIAERYCLTNLQFADCNKQIPDIRTLQAGEKVFVGKKCRVKTPVSTTAE